MLLPPTHLDSLTHLSNTTLYFFLSNSPPNQAPAHAAPKVLMGDDRQNAAWRGASILGSLGVMQQMWITKQEYNETGPLIIHRKCFL